MSVKSSNSAQFFVLAMLFLVHLTAFGLALQPLYSFMRTALTEVQLPAVTWFFPLGSVCCCLFNNRYAEQIARSILQSLAVSEALLAAGYVSMYCQAHAVQLRTLMTADLCQFSVLAFTLGFLQSLSFTLLICICLRLQPRFYHHLRSYGSCGWLLAGLMLTQLQPQSGTSLLLAVVLLAVVFLVICSVPIEVQQMAATPERDKASNTGNFLLLLVIALVSTVEMRFAINGYHYVCSSLGPNGQLSLMLPTAIEVILLRRLAGPLSLCRKVNALFIFLGPISWLVVSCALAAFETLGCLVLLSLALLSMNVLFYTSIAFRFSDIRMQARSSAAQAIGAITAYCLSLSDASYGVSLSGSWFSSIAIAFIACLLVTKALPCERQS